VQDNDAVIPEVAQGVLDVAHDLPIGVEPALPQRRGNFEAFPWASVIIPGSSTLGWAFANRLRLIVRRWFRLQRCS
jgi:hypothetical protein